MWCVVCVLRVVLLAVCLRGLSGRGVEEWGRAGFLEDAPLVGLLVCACAWHARGTPVGGLSLCLLSVVCCEYKNVLL